VTEVSIDCRDLSYLISRDTRHGVAGYRVSRYEEDTLSMNWDEYYQFYTSYRDVLDAIANPELQTEGRKRF
jgi:hypothetical protein